MNVDWKTPGDVKQNWQIVFKQVIMELKPIKTEADYRAALKRLEVIFDARFGTPESDELDILGLMVDDYENKYYQIEAPNPIEAIKIEWKKCN